MTFRATVLLPAVASLFLAGCDFEDVGSWGNSNAFKSDFHETRPLKAGGRLQLESFNGSVEITGWDQEQVDITGSKYASTAETRDAIKIDIQGGGDSLSIRTVRPGERCNCGARYTLKVPKRVLLDTIATSNGSVKVAQIDGVARLRTSNGAVEMVSLHGNLEARTSNGGVEVRDVDGDANVQTSNGRVRAEKVSGALTARTSNAGVRVQVAKGDRPVRVDTSNGGIELSFDQPAKSDVIAETSNGSITVRLPASAAGRVKARTSNGSVHTDFEVRREGESGKNHLDGSFGTGGPLYDLRTSNGAISLSRL